MSCLTRGAELLSCIEIIKIHAHSLGGKSYQLCHHLSLKLFWSEQSKKFVYQNQYKNTLKKTKNCSVFSYFLFTYWVLKLRYYSVNSLAGNSIKLAKFPQTEIWSWMLIGIFQFLYLLSIVSYIFIVKVIYIRSTYRNVSTTHALEGMPCYYTTITEPIKKSRIDRWRH